MGHSLETAAPEKLVVCKMGSPLGIFHFEDRGKSLQLGWKFLVVFKTILRPCLSQKKMHKHTKRQPYSLVICVGKKAIGSADRKLVSFEPCWKSILQSQSCYFNIDLIHITRVFSVNITILWIFDTTGLLNINSNLMLSPSCFVAPKKPFLRFHIGSSGKGAPLSHGSEDSTTNITAQGQIIHNPVSYPLQHAFKGPNSPPAHRSATQPFWLAGSKLVACLLQEHQSFEPKHGSNTLKKI